MSKEIRKGYAENSEEFHKEIMRVYKKTTFTGGGGTIDLFDFCDKITEITRLSSSTKDKAQAILDVRDSVVLKSQRKPFPGGINFDFWLMKGYDCPVKVHFNNVIPEK